MYSFNKKVSKHTKKQKSVIYLKEKKSIETVPEKDLPSDLLEKDF